MFIASGVNKMRTSKILRVNITAVDGVKHFVRIPEGYIFDGASIPRWAWSIVGYPFEPDLIEAACVHDWYCDRATHYFERVIGDNVFLKLLADAGVPTWRRAIMYAAVRLNTIINHREMPA